MAAAEITNDPAPCGGRLRILFVTSDKFPPFRPAAKFVFSEGLPSRGEKIDWLLQAAEADISGGARPYCGGTAHVAATNDGQTRWARVKKHCVDIRNDLRAFGLLRSGAYSLVQIKDKYLGALLVVAAAKIYGVPVFYWLAYPHAEASTYAAKRGVARYAFYYLLRGAAQAFLLYRIIAPACAHIFVQSEQMRRDVARRGIPLHKTTAVPSAVNLAEIDSSRPARYLSAARNTFVYLGTLQRERQLDFLVRVLKRVRERVPDARLLFVGKGEMPEDEALLRREAQRCGVSRAMTITGWLPFCEAWEHVRRAAVCVSPYYATPILLSTSPTKLVEYMALGRPVVASDHPEQSELVSQSGAGFVCSWDESEFAHAIVRLLDDPRMGDAMGRAGRRFVAAHRSYNAMVDLVGRRYREVLNESERLGGHIRSKRAEKSDAARGESD